jgi:N-methylhydantoinase A
LRFEVAERVRHTGEELTPLDEAATPEIARNLKDQNIGTLAVCFLHSYANPGLERRVREILLDEYSDCVVVISSDVAPEIREYERTSTAVINAATVPIISSYLDDLTWELKARGLKRDFYVMQSNGNVTAGATARKFPARTVMLGPSGGVVGTQFLASRAGLANVVTIDMGGTSSDMGMIAEGLAWPSMKAVSRADR